MFVPDDFLADFQHESTSFQVRINGLATEQIKFFLSLLNSKNQNLFKFTAVSLTSFLYIVF